jgi:uncharacterized delta-60 repeat protein
MKKYFLAAAVLTLARFANPTAHAQTSPLDPSFGIGGISVLDSVDGLFGVDMALQDDGKILITVTGNCNHGFLCRLLPNGQLDPSLQPSLPYRTYPVYHPGVIEMQGAACNLNMTTLRQLSSKKILWSIGPASIFQYNADGTTDTSFGTQGNTSIESNHPLSIHNIMDTKEVVGTGVLYAGSSFPPPMADTISLARMKYNGSLDVSFGTNGYVRAALPVSKVGPYSLIQCMKILPDNRVLVAGNCITPGSATSVDIFMALYNSNGTLDPGFGTGGVKVLDFNNAWDDVYSIAYRDNDNIYMMGASGTNRIVYKLDITGKLDNTFGTNGLASFPHASANGSTLFYGTVTPGNQVYTSVDTGAARRCSYLSYKSNGSANTSFGTNGIFASGTRDRVSNMIAQPDNKVLVLGTDGMHPRLLRFLGNGPTGIKELSPANQIQIWSADGRCFIDFGSKTPAFVASLLSVDGKVIGRWSAQQCSHVRDGVFAIALPQDMARGVYLMRVDGPSGATTVRLNN